MRKFLFFFLSFFVSCACLGQDFSDVVFLDNDTKELDYQAGQLIILTDKKEKPSEKFNPTQAVWHPSIPKISIKTPFQKEVLVPYVLHIPYFFINVQPLTDRSIVVSEFIQIVLPPNTPFKPFSRTYLTKIQDAKGNIHTFNPTFLYFKQNGSSVPFSLKEENGKVKIKAANEDIFYPSVYTYEISYLLPEAVQSVGEKDNVFLSLLGNDIPYLMENLVVQINLPKFTPLLKTDVFFGNENLKHPEAAYLVRENDEMLLLKTRGVYPEKIDVRLNIEMGKGIFEERNLGQKLFSFLFQNISLGITILGSVFIILYYVLAARLSWKEIKRPHFKKKINFQPMVMRHLLLKKIDYKTLFGLLVDLVERKILSVEKTEKDYVLTLLDKGIKQSRREKLVSNYLLGKKNKVKLSEIRVGNALTFLQKMVFSAERKTLYSLYLLPFLTGVVLIFICGFILFKAGISFNTMLLILGWFLIVYIFSWIYFKKHNAYPSYLKNAYEKEWQYLLDLPYKSGKNLAFYASMDIPLNGLSVKSSMLIHSGVSLDKFEKDFLDLFVLKGRKK